MTGSAPPGQLLPGPLEHGSNAAAALARYILRQRRRREDLLGQEHFADPAWDIMLDLFAAQASGERVATSSLIIAAAVPQSTALRRIRHLVLDGMLLETPDPRDGRRTFIALSDAMFNTVGQLLDGWVNDLPEVAKAIEHADGGQS